jgi:chaperonin GroES
VATKLTPLADRVLVRPIKEDEVTAGGVILPQNAQEKPKRGTVVAVGPGLPDLQGGPRQPIPVKEGQTVMFSQYGGVDLKIDDEPHLLLREGDLLGIIEEDEGE